MPLPDPIPAFDAFVAPARARPALWRTLCGAVIAGGLWLATILATAPFATRAGGFATPVGVLLYLASFAGLAAGAGLAARLLQARNPATLIGPGGFRPRSFAIGVAVVALVAIPTGLLTALVSPPERQLPLAAWAAWLPLALPAILVQSAAEELVFRGFLMQSLAARFRSPVAWWLLPSLLFGALHWNPHELGANAGLAVLASTVVGLALADVTARSGNLSAAIGLHFANNVIAMLVVALPSPVSGLALYLSALDPADTAGVRHLMLADLAATLAVWAIWRRVHARRRLHSGGPGSI